jgi:hypothetical protein
MSTMTKLEKQIRLEERGRAARDLATRLLGDRFEGEVVARQALRIVRSNTVKASDRAFDRILHSVVMSLCLERNGCFACAEGRGPGEEEKSKERSRPTRRARARLAEGGAAARPAENAAEASGEETAPPP